MKNNPEERLIGLLADQIQDDEKVLDGLGSGTLSLEELEAWRDRRWGIERDFLKQTIRLIEEMRKEGFGRMMRHSDMQRFGMSARRRRSAADFKTARPVKGKPAPKAKGNGKVRPDRFSLELKDLGLPCSLRVTGTYDDVLDAGAWHARHVHNLRGAMDSVRDTVKSAIVEEQTTPLSLAERYPGRRSEEQVSDEAANQTRSSGLGRR
jgi:hypothetical protein